MRGTMKDTKYPGYERLEAVFNDALRQAAAGKGKERHATVEPFHEQPICVGGREFGFGALLYQAWKKTRETARLYLMDHGEERALAEIYGAINYLAAAAIIIKEGQDGDELLHLEMEGK